MGLPEIVGFAAALCSMTSFVPQIVKIWRERDASSVALRMYVITVTGFSGRAVLESSGQGAAGVTGEFVVGGKHFFAESTVDGTFAFETLPLGEYTLALQDPIGAGIAMKRGTLAGVVDLGDVILDAASPMVGEMAPTPAASAVAKSTTIRLVMSEPIDPASVNSTPAGSGCNPSRAPVGS